MEHAAGRGEAPAVRAERHTPDGRLVAAKRGQFPTGNQVPDLDLARFAAVEGAAARGEAPAVWAELDMVDLFRVSLERQGQSARERLVDLHTAVLAGHRQPAAVRAERRRYGLGDG